jgi:hypothetical protein
MLFVTTERFKFAVLYYDVKTKEILTKSNGDLSERNGRPTDVGQIAAIDPLSEANCSSTLPRYSRISSCKNI